MSKFDSVASEAAYEIANHGFADRDFGTVGESTHWNALVTVSAVTLLNVGANELSDRFREDWGDNEITVHIREDNDGFVDVLGNSRAFGSSVVSVEKAFNEAEEMAEWIYATHDAYGDTYVGE